MERGNREIPESAKEQRRYELYQTEALSIAQRISSRWKQLESKVRANPTVLADRPELSQIYNLTSSPKSGIQRWFEGQVTSIEGQTGEDEDAKSRMMYRLKEDVERIEREVEEIIK